MAAGGRLEAVFTLPSSTITFDDTGTAAQVVTVTAGDYTITSLVAFLTSNVVGGGDWLITFSGGETGTGKITITTTDTPFDVTWSNTAIRTWMGFSANISGASTPQTGAHCRGVWIPQVVKWTQHGDDDGNGNAAVRNTVHKGTVSPQGDIIGVAGGSFKEFIGVRWQGLTRGRTKLIGESAESLTNGSFERFWGDVVLGDFALASAFNKVRFYWDAGAATYTDVRFSTLERFDPARLVENWIGRYTVEIPRLIVVD